MVGVKIKLTYSSSQNHSNPFNPATTIEFSVKKKSRVMIAVFNTAGQNVAVLVDKQMEAGKYTLNFNASRLSSGVYFYRMQAGNFAATRKLLFT